MGGGRTMHGELRNGVDGSASTLHSADLGLRDKDMRDLRGYGPGHCWETLGVMAGETWTWEFRPEAQVGEGKKSQSHTHSASHPFIHLPRKRTYSPSIQPSIHMPKSPSFYPLKPPSIPLVNCPFIQPVIHSSTYPPVYHPPSWSSTYPVYQPFIVWTDVEVILQTVKSWSDAHNGAKGPSHPLAKRVS